MNKLLFYLLYGPRVLLVYLRNRTNGQALELHSMTIQRTLRGRISRARLKWTVSGCHRIEVMGNHYPGTVRSVSILEHAQPRTVIVVFHGAVHSITVPVQLAASVTPLLEHAGAAMSRMSFSGRLAAAVDTPQATRFSQPSLRRLSGEPVPVRFTMPASRRLAAVSLNLQGTRLNLKIHL